jgi:hypothetical protein
MGTEGAQDLTNQISKESKSAVEASELINKKGIKLNGAELNEHPFEVYLYDGPVYRSPVKGVSNKVGDYGEIVQGELLIDIKEAKIILPGKVGTKSQGIDLIYKDNNDVWHFVEVKTAGTKKPWSTKLGELFGGKRQMSDEWIKGHLDDLYDDAIARGDTETATLYDQARTSLRNGNYMKDFTFVKTRYSGSKFATKSVLDDIAQNIETSSNHRRFIGIDMSEPI